MEIKTPYDHLKSSINSVTLRDAYLNGEQVGTRKVVDWITTNGYEYINRTGRDTWYIDSDEWNKRIEEWQAQLKDWGLLNEHLE